VSESVSETVTETVSETVTETRLSGSAVSFETVPLRKRNDSAQCGEGALRRRYGRRVGYKPRSFYPGAPTHVTAHGVDGEPIFRSDLDRFDLLARIHRVTERARWQIVAWCLMGTHYHLLVISGAEPRVSWAVQAINSVYAREFNRRHGRRGHLFGERFTDTLVESDSHLHACIDYILENPVRAGLVRRVEQWPWSGLERLERRGERAAQSVTRPR
jgi:REP element-mobilizing transposase RayT